MNWQIAIGFDPQIHPEDAARAVSARIAGSRRRGGEEAIVEDLFIASLATYHPWTIAQIEQLMKCSVDKNFCERLARAFADGKPPTWDEVDLLILKNWREVHLQPEIQAKIELQEGKLPGLRYWSPLAIEGLFKLGNVDVDCVDGNFDDWFRKRRQRLGLTGSRPYHIKRFIVKGDTIQIGR